MTYSIIYIYNGTSRPWSCLLQDTKGTEQKGTESKYMILPLNIFPAWNNLELRSWPRAGVYVFRRKPQQSTPPRICKHSLEPAQTPSIHSILWHKVPLRNYKLHKEPPPCTCFVPEIPIFLTLEGTISNRWTTSSRSITKTSVLPLCSLCLFHAEDFKPPWWIPVQKLFHIFNHLAGL